jgi:hypothetical protein
MTRNKPFIASETETRDLKIYTEKPKPGNTKRPKAAATKKTGRPRKPLNPQELKTTETKLKHKYPNIVNNSLLNATKGEPTEGLTTDEITRFNHKRSVIITCTCGATRRIATSDLAQVSLCENCTRENRNRRKRERRAQNPTTPEKTQ